MENKMTAREFPPKFANLIFNMNKKKLLKFWSFFNGILIFSKIIIRSFCDAKHKKMFKNFIQLLIILGFTLSRARTQVSACIQFLIRKNLENIENHVVEREC